MYVPPSNAENTTSQVSNKENKTSVIAEIKKPKKTKKKKARAIIPTRPYHGATGPSMNNTTGWNSHSLKYNTPAAASRRSIKVTSMDTERGKAHAEAVRVAKVAPER